MSSYCHEAAMVRKSEWPILYKLKFILSPLFYFIATGQKIFHEIIIRQNLVAQAYFLDHSVDYSRHFAIAPSLVFALL